jgi:tetratricopeptide (TPR) repeat protein
LIAVIGLYRPTSDADLGYNSIAANLFQFQINKFQGFSGYSWPLLARLSGNNPQTIAFLGQKILEVGQIETAVDAFNFSLKQKENAPAHLGLAIVSLKYGDYQQALSHYQQAYAVNGDPRIFSALGETFTGMGQLDSSNFYLHRYLSYGDSLALISPPQLIKAGLGFFTPLGKDKALAKLSENYIDCGELDSAKFFLEQISEPGSITDFNLVAKAKYSLALKDTASASQFLLKALQINPRIHFQLKMDRNLSPLLDKFPDELK